MINMIFTLKNFEVYTVRYYWLKVRCSTVELQGLLILLNLNFMPVDRDSTSLYPQPLATPIPYFDSVSLTVLDTSYKWNDTVLVFLWPAYVI